MLGTDPHELAELVGIVEHVDTKDACLTLRRLEEASQHRDGGRLTGTVVAEQDKNLIFVHFEIDPIDSLEAVLVLLEEVFDLQVCVA